MRIAIAAASILGLAAAAAADTIRVPQDQATIQAGVNAASTGDTVLVSKGVYTENVVVAIAGVTIKGAGAILDGNIAGTDGPCLTGNAADLTVTGMTFRNGTNQVLGNAAGLTLLKCTFIEAGSIAVDAISTGTVVEGCKFYGTSGLAIRNVALSTAVRKCTFLHGGNGGIEITGNGATVESCTFTSVDDNESIQITGDGARVVKNKFSRCANDCIRIIGSVVAAATIESNKGDRLSARLVNVSGASAAVGANCTVQKNSASYCVGAINVLGNACTVLSNKVSNNLNTDAITVSGDGITVSSNTVATTWNDADAIALSSDTAAGGGTVSGNKVSDSAGYGFVMSTVFALAISSNSATRCGEDNRGGFFLSGDNNTMENCAATEGDRVGIEVTGNGNSLIGCKSSKAATVGILVSGGNLNTLTNCSVTAAGLEGMTNQATNTNLVGGKYQGLRFDVANDVGGGATFTDPTLAGVSFSTGGAAQQSHF